LHRPDVFTQPAEPLHQEICVNPVVELKTQKLENLAWGARIGVPKQVTIPVVVLQLVAAGGTVGAGGVVAAGVVVGVVVVWVVVVVVGVVVVDPLVV
jgi:hypothetical protein